MYACRAGLAFVLFVLPPNLWACADEPAELLKQAREAFAAGKADEAVRLADRAVAADAKNVDAYLLRGQLHERLANHAKAIADFTKVINLDAKAALAYDLRGSSHFKLGKFAESLADFDAQLKLNPADGPGHWRRGITCYYAGKFAEGCKQFNAYEKFDANDVENATWHFLCNARLVGVEKAQANILKIGKDRRVPMRQIYDLYAGIAKSGDVLAAVDADRPSAEERGRRLFYAHLYLGLYHEVLGEKQKAIEHVTKAADEYRINHYMGEVARVHKELLKKMP